MNINKLLTAINKYNILIKYADNMFIPNFDNTTKNRLNYHIMNIYRCISIFPTIIDIYNKNIEENKKIKFANYLLQSNSSSYFETIFDNISNILYLFNLEKSEEQSFIILKIFENIDNDFSDIINCEYALKNIDNIKKTNIKNILVNLCDSILEEEISPSSLWKEFFNQIEYIISELFLFCEQIFSKNLSELSSSFKNLINSIELESSKIADKWDKIFDEIEYEEKINDLDPEDLEY